MNLNAIIERVAAGQELADEERSFLAAHLDQEQRAGRSAEIRSAVESALEPYLQPLRSFNPNGGGSGDAPAYQVNAISDLIHSMHKGVPHEQLVAKGMTEGTTTAGGYLVPNIYRDEVLASINEYGIAMRDCQVIQLTGKTILTPKVSTGLTGYWVDEASAVTESQLVLTQLSTAMKKLGAITVVSNELLDDSTADLQSLLRDETAIAFANKLDNELFQGTGSPITGILNSTDVETYEVEGGLSGLTYDHIEEITSELSDQKLAGASWYGHRKVFSSLRKIKDDNGNPLYVPNPSAGAPADVHGFPVVKSEAMPSAPADDDGFLILGNLRRTCRIFMGSDMSVVLDRSAYVGSTSVFETDQAAIRTIMRVTIELARPEWLVVVKGAA